jgi:hypothetical protein
MHPDGAETGLDLRLEWWGGAPAAGRAIADSVE